MGNFSNVVVTNAGLQLINEAIGGGDQVNIVTAQVGSGYPAPASDPRDLSALVQFVMDATTTSANDQVLYQTTVRISVSSGLAPVQFQLNEIGVFAQIGTQTPVLFAYASSQAQGDYITPDPSPNPIQYDYAILIQYEADSPVTATVTMTPVLELHAATHRGTGTDPIGLADATASGLLMSPPGDATKVLLGTIPQSFGKIPLHAPTHLDNGTDPIPVATTVRTGLLPQLSGDSNTVLQGTGAWGAGFFPGFITEYGGSAAPSGWLLCDGKAYSRTAYAALFAVVGTAYGAGDGSTTFNVPDCRGRASVGAGQGTGLTLRAIGQQFGEENHILGTAEMPSHNHNVNESPHTHVAEAHTHSTNESPHAHGLSQYQMDVTNAYAPPDNCFLMGWGPRSWVGTIEPTLPVDSAKTNISINPATSTIDPSITGVSTQNAGSGAQHNNIQPCIAISKIIKT